MVVNRWRYFVVHFSRFSHPIILFLLSFMIQSWCSLLLTFHCVVIQGRGGARPTAAREDRRANPGEAKARPFMFNFTADAIYQPDFSENILAR